MPAAATTSVRLGLPSVSVPVLSSTIASMPRDALQRGGVLDQDVVPRADAGADGHRRRRRQAERVGAGDHHRRDGEGERHHEALAAEETSRPAKVTSPEPTARMTRYCAALSASRCPGAFDACACCTSATICASAVSAPTLRGAEGDRCRSG